MDYTKTGDKRNSFITFQWSLMREALNRQRDNVVIEIVEEGSNYYLKEKETNHKCDVNDIIEVLNMYYDTLYLDGENQKAWLSLEDEDKKKILNLIIESIQESFNQLWVK